MRRPKTHTNRGSSQVAILGHMECCSLYRGGQHGDHAYAWVRSVRLALESRPRERSSAGSTPQAQHYFSHTRYGVHSPTWHVIQCADCSLIYVIQCADSCIYICVLRRARPLARTNNNGTLLFADPPKMQKDDEGEFWIGVSRSHPPLAPSTFLTRSLQARSDELRLCLHVITSHNNGEAAYPVSSIWVLAPGVCTRYTR